MKKDSKTRKITISEEDGKGVSITWSGFTSAYEILGFVDVAVNPQLIRQKVMQAFQAKAVSKPSKKEP